MNYRLYKEPHRNIEHIVERIWKSRKIFLGLMSLSM